MAMANAARSGLRKTIGFCLGVSTGFAIVLSLCSYLNLVLSDLLPRFRLIMSVVGAAYLIYLAVKIVRNTGSGHSDRSEPAPLYWTGLGLQFVNPKGIMYGITVFGSFVLPDSHSQGFLLTITVFLAMLALTSTICWALFGSVFQRLFARYQRQFNLVMALLLVYCAVSVLH
jgi:threonine/homoserine/homoserine lactone efflux protein